MCNIKDNKKILGEKLVGYKKTLILSKIQKEVLIGTLLGDATIVKQKTKSYNVKFEQSLKHQEYIYHLFEIFKDWVGTGPQIRNILKNGNILDRKSIWFRTYRHISFLFYYNIFYNNGKKRVPLILNRIITERVLAYWFMDDGCKSKNGYHLNTQGFEFFEQKKLVNILNKKYDLDARIYKDRKYYFICIYNYKKFYDLINPYILESMRYKLHEVT